jgi:general secretion pathway protein D
MLQQLRNDMAANGGPGGIGQTNPPVSPPVLIRANPPQPAPPQPGPQSAAPGGPGPSLAINVPAAPLAAGASFQVPVVLNGAVDISSVALQLHYDPTRLMLINLAPGDFLTRDGQAAPPIHSDQPVGTLTVGASRPPGTHGVSGNGVVCVLTFQARTAGPSDLSIGRAALVNSAQQQLQVASAQASVTVR